ncbi:hydroxyethylthiazole kinase [Lentilactobacillus fungorum]|uniref:Hydroxyethylthiazole kinase n=1 Tax=Lentilactobacillus fungorum TaxID=2201250 RepID=A0ABQ3W2W0_9LACO|nr:hydroxyethylthiazole kinase [Lentilactobacillus fungorum]GHP14802.1 hydroxyethylthiazole kinase [Lentilactobacillus fungorum]
MKISLLETLREKNPIAFNISNFVTVQDVANGINALGASPIMSEEQNEAEAMVKMCNSVTINLGAFTEGQLEQIATVSTFANQYGKPIVIDPVAVGAVAYRTERCNELLDQTDVAVIRGNAGEIAALAGVEWQSKGIDAGEGSGDLEEIAKKLAKKRHCVVVESGKTDIITDGEAVVRVFNETDLFKLHVGSGDMLSSTIGCFCGIEKDAFEAAQTATVVFDVAGEIVAKSMKQPLAGSFGPQLIDQLHLIDVKTVEKYAQYE